MYMRVLVLLCVLGSVTEALAKVDDPANVSKPTSSETAPTSSITTTANTDSALPTGSSSILIPARTPVIFTLDSAVSSKTALPGTQFLLKVAQDLKINGQVLIPQGTPATGEVIHAQKASGFGKAGELLVTIRYIDLNGNRIKMRSFRPYQGSNKSGTVMAVSQIPYIGLFAGFIQGGEIIMPENTLVEAQLALETSLSPIAVSPTENKEAEKIPTPQTTEVQTNGDSK